MKALTKYFSSLSLTCWTVVWLWVWCAAGVTLAGSRRFSSEFFKMNNMLIRDWFMSPDSRSLALKLWLIGLCAGMVVLGINLAFCSWNKFFRLTRIPKAKRSKYLMLLIHLLFGLAALGHFVSFVVGYKHENIRLYPEDSFSFGDGLNVKLVDIHFVDNPGILLRCRKNLTSADFHYKQNYAEIVLSRAGSEISRDKAFVLEPIRFDEVQITLKGFIPVVGNSTDLGVNLVISKNPVFTPFMIIYPLMILGMSIYLATTWQATNRNSDIKSRGGREL